MSDRKEIKDLLQALQDSVDKAIAERKPWQAWGPEATWHGGHLDTCDALFGIPRCSCGKEDQA